MAQREGTAQVQANRLRIYAAMMEDGAKVIAAGNLRTIADELESLEAERNHLEQQCIQWHDLKLQAEAKLQALDALPAATTPAVDLQGRVDAVEAYCQERVSDLGFHHYIRNTAQSVLNILVAPAVPAPAPETDDERWARLSAKQPAVPVAQPDQFGESNDLNGLIQPTRSPEELAAEIIDAIPAMPDPWGEPDGEPHKTVVALIRAYLKGD